MCKLYDPNQELPIGDHLDAVKSLLKAFGVRQDMLASLNAVNIINQPDKLFKAPNFSKLVSLHAFQVGTLTI